MIMQSCACWTSGKPRCVGHVRGAAAAVWRDQSVAPRSGWAAPLQHGPMQACTLHLVITARTAWTGQQVLTCSIVSSMRRVGMMMRKKILSLVLTITVMMTVRITSRNRVPACLHHLEQQQRF